MLHHKRPQALFANPIGLVARYGSLGASAVRSLSTGSALLIGKTRALRITGANAAWGRNYSREFGQWMIEHGFGHMPKATRSVAITLAAEAITAWRNALPERQRRRLINPQSVVKRWRSATQPPSDPSDGVVSIETTRSIATLKHDAKVAWRRFVVLCEALPADLAAEMWREVQTRSAEFLSPHQGERDRDHHHSDEDHGFDVH
jgi:hypothetical protein